MELETRSLRARHPEQTTLQRFVKLTDSKREGLNSRHEARNEGCRNTSGSIVEATSNKESFPKSIMLDSVFASTSIFCRTGPEGCPGKPFSIKNKISLSVVHSRVHNALRLSLVTESAFGFTVIEERKCFLCYAFECNRIATYSILEDREDWAIDQTEA